MASAGKPCAPDGTPLLYCNHKRHYVPASEIAGKRGKIRRCKACEARVTAANRNG